MTQRQKDYNFIKKISSFSLKNFLEIKKISKSSFYKGLLSDDEIHKLKLEIIDYLFNE